MENSMDFDFFLETFPNGAGERYSFFINSNSCVYWVDCHRMAYWFILVVIRSKLYMICVRNRVEIIGGMKIKKLSDCYYS